MNLYLNCYRPDSQLSFTKANYLLKASDYLGIEKDVIKMYEGQPNAEYILNIEPFQRFFVGTKFTGIWEIDMTFDRPQMNLSNWIASDMVFVANSNLPERMKAYKGPKTLLFQACDPMIHRRIPEIIPQFDFVLCGSNGLEPYIERGRVINLLIKEGFSFHDYGKGFSPDEYVRNSNDARVQFIRSAGNKDISPSQVEQRFFECLAIGPVLKDYHPDLEILGLTEGKDFFWYKDDSEMLIKMHYLIDNPEFAKEMATNGRKKALEYHSYSHRLSTIINLIKEHEYRHHNS